MKSLYDEIRSTRVRGEDGFDFIVSTGVPRSELVSFWGSRMRTISSEGSTRGFHRGIAAISFLLFQAFKFIAEYQTRRIQYFLRCFCSKDINLNLTASIKNIMQILYDICIFILQISLTGLQFVYYCDNILAVIQRRYDFRRKRA